MNIDEIIKSEEKPNIEFKRQWYTNSSKLDEKGWGECIKDIISLANSNIGYINKSSYLVIGVDDVERDENKNKRLHEVKQIGMLSNLQALKDRILRKVSSACSPNLSNIEIKILEYNSTNILLVIIPPPLGLLKLDRDLNTRGMLFKKGTVLIRVGQDISVASPIEINALQNEVNNSHKPKINIKHNVPQPDYINFIGRDDEIKKLLNLLDVNNRSWIVVIDGVGGVGKSALALEIAHHYIRLYNNGLDNNFFDAIIWVSAKTSHLTADGIKPKYQAINTIKDIYTTIENTLESNFSNNFNKHEYYIYINKILTKQRTLIIVDNLETIDDPQVDEFLRDLPSPTKCIVTTRHRIDVAYPIRLTGLPKNDGYYLIEQECRKKGVAISSDDIDLLYKRTGGLPLAIVWCIAQVAYGYDIKDIFYRLGNPNSDIIKFSFEQSLSAIKNKPPHLLLIIISLSSSINREQLFSISGLSKLDCDEGLVSLEKLSLINKKGSSFDLLPLVRDYVLSTINSFKTEQINKILIDLTKIKASVSPYLLSVDYYNNYLDIQDDVADLILTFIYEYDNYYDEHSVYYYLSDLERIGGKKSIACFKSMLEYHHHLQSVTSNWVEELSIEALIKYQEFNFLIGLLQENNSLKEMIRSKLCKINHGKLRSIIKKYCNEKQLPVSIRKKITEYLLSNNLKTNYMANKQFHWM